MHHTKQNSCRSSTTHLAQPNAPAMIAPIQLLPSSLSHVNSGVNANDMMCGSCSFVHSAPTIGFAYTDAIIVPCAQRHVVNKRGVFNQVLIKASTTPQSMHHTKQNSCRSSTTHLAQPNAPAVIAPIQLLPSSPSHVNSGVNANDMMCGSCSFVHSAPTIVFACTCAASNLPSSCIAVQYRVSIALSRPPLFSSTDFNHRGPQNCRFSH